MRIGDGVLAFVLACQIAALSYGQESALPASPVARVALSSAESKAALHSGAGNGKVTFKLGGRLVEQIGFRIFFQGNKFAVTCDYPFPRKGHESITRQTMVTDGFLTFATQFSDRLRGGHATYVWREGKSVGRNPGLLAPNLVFPYEPTKLFPDVPGILGKFDVTFVFPSDDSVHLTYNLSKKTKCTLIAEAHSGFNVTKATLDDEEGLYQVRSIGWERKNDIWYVRQHYKKEFARARRFPSEDREQTLEYDQFEPNAEIDEKSFDLSRVEDGWYNERLMYPHGKP